MKIAFVDLVDYLVSSFREMNYVYHNKLKEFGFNRKKKFFLSLTVPRRRITFAEKQFLKERNIHSIPTLLYTNGSCVTFYFMYLPWTKTMAIQNKMIFVLMIIIRTFFHILRSFM